MCREMRPTEKKGKTSASSFGRGGANLFFVAVWEEKKQPLEAQSLLFTCGYFFFYFKRLYLYLNKGKVTLSCFE